MIKKTLIFLLSVNFIMSSGIALSAEAGPMPSVSKNLDRTNYDVADVGVMTSLEGKDYAPEESQKVKAYAASETPTCDKSLVKLKQGFRVVKKVF